MSEQQNADSIEEQINQTLFSNQEPLLQSSKSSFVKKQSNLEEKKKEKSPQQKMILIAVGVLGIFIIIIFILVLLKPRQSSIPVPVTPLASPVVQSDKTQFQQRLDELNTDLLQADPAKLDLSVPPVDMFLTLDPVKK